MRMLRVSPIHYFLQLLFIVGVAICHTSALAVQVDSGSVYVVEDTMLVWCDEASVVVFDRQFLIKVGSVSDDSVAALLPDGVELVIGAQEIGWATIRVADSLDYCEAYEDLVVSPGISDVNFNTAYSPHVLTDDPYVPIEGMHPDSAMYWLRNLGPLNDSDWIRGSDTKAVAAWDIGRGSHSIKVSILETGIPYDWTPGDSTFGELGNQDLDDSGRIHLDTNYLTALGESPFDFRDFTCNHGGWPPAHGHAVLGVYGAEADNSYGAVGIDHESQVYFIKSHLLLGDISKAIRRSATKSRVYGMSAGEFSHSSSLEEAVKIAHDSDMLIVVSAGNASPSCFGGQAYPAAFAEWGTLPGHTNGYANVISVAGTNARDSIWPASCRSNDSQSVTICSPADKILTLYDCSSQNDLEYMVVRSGTSFSAPTVCGVASLILGRWPAISADSVRRILISTADKIWKDPNKPAYADRIVNSTNYADSARHPWYGYGRLNAYKALGGKSGTLSTQTWVWSDSETDTIWLSECRIPSGETVTIDGDVIVRISRDDLEVSGLDTTLVEITVEGTLEINGSSISPAFLQPAAEEDLPAWYGIHVKAGGHLVLKNAVIKNAVVAVTLDSGATIDTIVGCSFVDCNVGIDVNNSSPLVMRKVTMTGMGDYGIYAEEGHGVIRLDSAVTISGREDTTIAVFVADDSRVVAKWCTFENDQSGIRANRQRHRSC